MTARRNFLALVGGAMFSGAVVGRAAAKVPTLILPPALVPPAPGRPLLDGMRANGESLMAAFLAVGQRIPRPAFLDWLEDGLERSVLYPEPDHAAEEWRITAAVAKHGSIVEAMRAGAL